MVVIIDFEVPTEQFALGRLFQKSPDVEVGLERVVPISSSVIPLIWVSGVDPEAFERELRTDPLVHDVRLLTKAGERALYRIDWDGSVDGLVQPMVENDADLLRGEGSPDTWEFRVQFPDRDQLVAFREDCLEHGVRIDLLRVYNPGLPTESGRLTDAQVDALVAAYENGYWQVPRETNLARLGEMMGISDTAVSQRLRRGTNTLVEEYVLPEVDS